MSGPCDTDERMSVETHCTPLPHVQLMKIIRGWSELLGVFFSTCLDRTRFLMLDGTSQEFYQKTPNLIISKTCESLTKRSIIQTAVPMYFCNMSRPWDVTAEAAACNEAIPGAWARSEKGRRSGCFRCCGALPLTLAEVTLGASPCGKVTLRNYVEQRSIDPSKAMLTELSLSREEFPGLPAAGAERDYLLST
ncbi:unnamed protein product [Ranitomeya imitator]|uniref:Uncharacterized protein n=1 Tax=Ranitomeya imitator TaxID=111125 RepID=A0ABN9KMW1_9NEOB|nr:unnamed protein product [Ranitomeya imitator]